MPESKSRMKKILDSLPEMQYVVDREGILRYVKFAKGTKGSFDPVKSLGKPAGSVLPPSVAPLIMGKVRVVFETGSAQNCEFTLQIPENPEPMHLRAHLDLLDKKEVLVSVRDVTARVVAEKKLTESEQRYRRLFDLSPLPKTVLDVESLRFLDVNKAALTQYGYTKKEFIALPPAEIFSPEEMDERFRILRENGPCEEVAGIWKHRKKDGTVIQVEVFCHEISFKARPAKILVCHDISDQVAARRALEESEEKFLSAFQTNPDAVTLSRIEDGVLIEVNEGFLKFSGYSRDEALGKSTLDLNIWPDPAVRSDFVQKLQAQGSVKDFEGVMLNRTGNPKAVLLSANVVKIEGKPHMLAVASDVSAIKKTQKALEESEEKFRKAFMASPDAITMSRIETGLFTDVNPGFLKITGYTREEVVGKTSIEIDLWMEPEDRELLVKALKDRGFADNLEIRYRAKDGSVIYGLTSGTLIFLGEDRYILTVTRDMTQSRKAQMAIKESEERFRAIFDTSPNAILLVDLKTRKITDVNQGLAIRSGYRKEEVIGRTTEELGLWENPSDRDNMYRILEKTGEVDGFEGRFITKDGSGLRGLLSARLLQIDERPHILVTVHDVSTLLETQRMLRASLAEKEVLLREVHHRVKNNLQVILGLLNLQEHHLEDERGRQIFKESQNRILTMSLIHEVLYQSRELGRINFQDYLVNLTNNLFSSYGVSRDRVGLLLEVEKSQVVVDTAIPCGLIINELVTNALKHAFPDDRKGIIKVFFGRRKPHGYRLEVKDNGIGIPRNLDVCRAGSLGLQLVVVLLEQLNGRLELIVEGGTAFRMDFEEYHEAGATLY